MPILLDLFRRNERSFSSLENPSVPLAAGGDWGLDVFGGFRSTSGVNVNRETALTYASFWRAINLVSNDVAKLPVHVYNRGDNGKGWDTKHPAYYLLRFKPNAEMVAFQFKKTLQMHCLCEGNGYAYIDRDGAGNPLELVPLQPNRTYPIRANGRLIYITELNSGEPRKIVPENMLHIKGLSFDGLVGYSVITKARESLGLGMAMDTYGSTFFRNGAEPSIAIIHPGRLSPEAIQNLRNSWAKMHAGLENAHKTAILQEGMKIQQYSMTGRDAQLIEQRQFQKHEIADWFGLPPHKLGILEGQAYNSLEQENQSYLDSAIDPWLVAWEEECNDKLLTEYQKKRDTHCVEFHRKSLIRANMAERTSYYTSMLQCGVLNRDEVREEEGYNPIADGSGKVYLMPLNMGQSGGGPSDTEATPAPPPSSGALLEVPDIRQPDHYSCGACAAMCVGRYFGVGPESLQEWKDALKTDIEQSTRPMAIVEYLARLGLVVTARHNMTLDDLRRCWQAGQPVICCVQDYADDLPPEAKFDYGHYLTVIGHLPGYLVVQDSSEDNVTADSGTDAAPGKGIIAEQTWLDNWHDTDIAGNPYLRFGIAVGTELLPGQGPDGNDGSGDQDDPDSQAQGNPGQQIQPANQTGNKEGQFAGPANGLPIAATPARCGKCGKNHKGRCGGEGSGVPGPCPMNKTKETGKGDKSGGVQEQEPSEKAKRAKESMKLIDKRVQRYAEEHNEPALAKKLGGQAEPDNKPYDVKIDKDGKPKHGIEMKTMVDNKNNKLTMKGSAQNRKIQWEKDNKATFHTVVYDDQKVFNALGEGKHDESKRDIYYKRGGGSFRVGSMYKCKDHDELKKLLDMKTKDLPKGAQPTPQWVARQEAVKEGKK